MANLKKPITEKQYQAALELVREYESEHHTIEKETENMSAVEKLEWLLEQHNNAQENHIEEANYWETAIEAAYYALSKEERATYKCVDWTDLLHTSMSIGSSDEFDN